MHPVCYDVMLNQLPLKPASISRPMTSIPLHSLLKLDSASTKDIQSTSDRQINTSTAQVRYMLQI